MSARLKLLLAALAVVLVTAGLSVWSWHNATAQGEFRDCQVGVNDALIAAQRQRAAAAEADRAADKADREAIDAMVLAVTNARGTAEVQAALRGYLLARAKNDAARVRAEAQRAANPLPEQPSRTCG